ncbi:hypothetical protein AVEN_38966-1 [Araneus ventricosus]|uniref:Uncharacterized protein n=1 Tax=Araneus ventricosus TaxID=182803 RepID=A0A4Y2MPH5_ARAVE|nr:hypothetical protein AVEN_38966-1 [Araneus ventricosus]
MAYGILGSPVPEDPSSVADAARCHLSPADGLRLFPPRWEVERSSLGKVPTRTGFRYPQKTSHQLKVLGKKPSPNIRLCAPLFFFFFSLYSPSLLSEEEREKKIVWSRRKCIRKPPSSSLTKFWRDWKSS